MAEKPKYVDRMIPTRRLDRFNTSLLSNDGGKYSPSLRRLCQHYLHDSKFFPGKVFSATTQPSPLTTVVKTQVRESESGSPSYIQSPIDSIASSLKCDDCQKHDGLFQCCHCNQHLCIRCCNKHYKKVTIELECLHTLSDRLVTKIIHTKNDLERQKNDTLKQCHKWRIDTINTITKAHTLIIQTIHDEYEVIVKEYELFLEKEMSHINIDKNDLIRMKKGNLSSLLSSVSSSSTIDPTNSIDTIKTCIETFNKYIDKTGKISFQVKLPTVDIGDNLTVESHFGDITRSTGVVTRQNEEISEKEPSPDFPTVNSSFPEYEATHSSEKDSERQPSSQTEHDDSAYATSSSSPSSSLHDQSEHYSSTSYFLEPSTHHFDT